MALSDIQARKLSELHGRVVRAAERYQRLQFAPKRATADRALEAYTNAEARFVQYVAICTGVFVSKKKVR